MRTRWSNSALGGRDPVFKVNALLSPALSVNVAWLLAAYAICDGVDQKRAHAVTGMSSELGSFAFFFFPLSQHQKSIYKFYKVKRKARGFQDSRLSG